jgi:HK97 family phage portal protein
MWPFGKAKTDQTERLGSFEDAEEKSLTGSDLERIVWGSRGSDGPFTEIANVAAMELAKKSVVLYSCASTLADAFAQAPFAVRSPDGTVTTQHAMLEAFRSSPVLSEALLKQYMVLHLKLSGVSYLWRFFNARGTTLELLPIPPQMIEPIYATRTFATENQETKLVDGYRLTSDGVQTILTPEEVVVTRYPDPSNLAGFWSPARMTARNVEMDRRAEDYQAESLDNLKLPGLVVQTRKPLGESQKRDLRAAIEKKIGRGSRAGGGLLTLSGDDVKFEALNPLGAMDWSSMYNLDESRICMALGVPPIVIGARVGLENSPWSNVGEAKRWFYQTTVRSMWAHFGGELTFTLMPRQLRMAGWAYCFDWSKIDEMQEEQDARATRASTLFVGGIATRNEARELAGLAPVAGGDVFKVGAMDVFQSKEEDPTAMPEVDPQTDAEHLADTDMGAE